MKARESVVPARNFEEFSWTKGEEAMTAERIKDLKLAASFVRSIETTDHTVNLEIQQLARRIERLASQLGERRPEAEQRQAS
ncbi:MAG: hypothetical protein OEM59_19490 [Rhodospirillales bacterium]|nr:hypothetical protein [Rhodospirillales bacterium]